MRRIGPAPLVTRRMALQLDDGRELGLKKVAELKALCKALKLPSGGKKAELIARLQQASSSPSSASPAAAPSPATSPSTPPRLLVIGGGAAGVFGAIHAAATARSRGIELPVTVLEAGPKPLSKVLISGGGRCNVMHDCTKPPATLVQGYPRGARELLGPFTAAFGAREASEWFRERGVELKTEGDGRMFPVTDSSATIANALLDAAAEVGVEIVCKAKVVDVVVVCDEREGGGGGGFEVVVQQADGQTVRHNATSVLIAAGSSRKAWEWAARLGHRLVSPAPSLFTLDLEEVKGDAGEGNPWLRDLAGISVPHATVTLLEAPKPDAAGAAAAAEGEKGGAGTDKKKKRKKKSKRGGLCTQAGPLLVTHKGLSGPAALRLSAFAARELAESEYSAAISVNWCGDEATRSALTTAEVLHALAVMKTSSDAKKEVATFCPELAPPKGGQMAVRMPRRLWVRMLEAAGVRDKARWADLSNTQLERLARTLTDCRLSVTGKGTFKDEFVTAGGVALGECNMKTMESRRVPGLFFAGEVLDIDGVTGGFNFQSCWTTGFLSGSAIGQHGRTAV